MLWRLCVCGLRRPGRVLVLHLMPLAGRLVSLENPGNPKARGYVSAPSSVEAATQPHPSVRDYPVAALGERIGLKPCLAQHETIAAGDLHRTYAF